MLLEAITYSPCPGFSIYDAYKVLSNLRPLALSLSLSPTPTAMTPVKLEILMVVWCIFERELLWKNATLLPFVSFSFADFPSFSRMIFALYYKEYLRFEMWREHDILWLESADYSSFGSGKVNNLLYFLGEKLIMN
jgi:hypothetical protein